MSAFALFLIKTWDNFFPKKSANAGIQLFKLKSLSTLWYHGKKRSFQMWQNRCQHRDTMKKRSFQMWHFRVLRLKNPQNYVFFEIHDWNRNSTRFFSIPPTRTRISDYENPIPRPNCSKNHPKCFLELWLSGLFFKIQFWGILDPNLESPKFPKIEFWGHMLKIGGPWLALWWWETNRQQTHSQRNKAGVISHFSVVNLSRKPKKT